MLHCHHRRTKPRPQSSTYTELAAYTAEDGLLCVRLETTLLSHARWPGAVYQNRTKGQRALPVPAVQWLLCRFSTAYFVEIDNFEPFSESLHINGRNFPDVFIRSRLRMTPINHETFYGNRSTRFPKIRITDTLITILLLLLSKLSRLICCIKIHIPSRTGNVVENWNTTRLHSLCNAKLTTF